MWKTNGTESATAAQAIQAADGVAGHVMSGAPEQSGPERRQDDEKRDSAHHPERGVRRQQERRQARRMNRVDLTVRATAQEVWRQSAREERRVIVVVVVVLDPEVAVFEQAVADDQIVRLVATGMQVRHQRIPARIHGQRREKRQARRVTWAQ